MSCRSSTARGRLRIAAAVALVSVSSCTLVVSFDDLPTAPRGLSGTVSGLANATISLQLSTKLIEAANGPFSFPAILPHGVAYSLTIPTQPAGHHCSIRGGQGTVGNRDIAGVEVLCKLEKLTRCDAGVTGGEAPCP